MLARRWSYSEKNYIYFKNKKKKKKKFALFEDSWG